MCCRLEPLGTLILLAHRLAEKRARRRVSKRRVCPNKEDDHLQYQYQYEYTTAPT